MKRLGLLTCVWLVGQGCVLNPIRWAEDLGSAGWFEVDTRPRARAYGDRFQRLRLGVSSPSCDAIKEGQHGAGPVLVLVPGIQGDGQEWQTLIPKLQLAEPASVYMFRWMPFDERDALASKLAAGIGRLMQCLPPEQGPVVILAHSAGGVIASFAASLIAVRPVVPQGEKARVVVLTVASALAGAQLTRPKPDGSPEARFMLDLGNAIAAYPPPAPGVEVFHLRTHYPSDPVMKPSRAGNIPNDPSIGVPGARHVDLPPSLGHDAALGYVGRRLTDGTWTSWRRASPGDLTVY